MNGHVTCSGTWNLDIKNIFYNVLRHRKPFVIKLLQKGWDTSGMVEWRAWQILSSKSNMKTGYLKKKMSQLWKLTKGIQLTKKHLFRESDWTLGKNNESLWHFSKGLLLHQPQGSRPWKILSLLPRCTDLIWNRVENPHVQGIVKKLWPWWQTKKKNIAVSLNLWLRLGWTINWQTSQKFNGEKWMRKLSSY